MAWLKEPRAYILSGAGLVLLILLLALYLNSQFLAKRYRELESPAILDRTGVVLTIIPNSKQEYGRYMTSLPGRQAGLPDQIKKLLVLKEDKFFYWHPGINPVSLARAFGNRIIGRDSGGASTITQQLAKNLLGNESSRTLSNKVAELFGAFSLELFNSKETILEEYANTIYMGHQVRGLGDASNLYFGRPLEELNESEIVMLLATISSPSTQNPWEKGNTEAARSLAKRISVTFYPELASLAKKRSNAAPRNFELAALGVSCAGTCHTLIDSDLTDRLRKILKERVTRGWSDGARSGAIIAIKLPENEVISIVGTPDVSSMEAGQQINMASEPRAIGSTVKPFIYLEGFAKGLRPYTLVNDREYKLSIGTGFPLYPKNYDGQYHGWVTLHSALSSSLNVPTVKVLQFIGLTNFYDFLQNSLGFKPIRDLDEYQYGIALGALDMDPLSLAHYLTIFPNQGVLRPLQLFSLSEPSPREVRSPTTQADHQSAGGGLTSGLSAYSGPGSARGETSRRVADPAMTQLVTKILNDRYAGVEQFGLAGNLNLSQTNYAVKTGTSEDYRDSWTVGYTPDFLVVVWLGNPDGTPLKHTTGQSGAGAVWHDTMELLFNSSYNHKTPFDFSKITSVQIGNGLDFGIPNEKITDHRNLLPDEGLITSPQNGDTFLWQNGMSIPLMAQQEVTWYANDQLVGNGERLNFSPTRSGQYQIRAVSPDGQTAQIKITIREER